MNYFPNKIKSPFAALMCACIIAFAALFGSSPVSAQSNAPDQYDPQKFEADEARRVAERKVELRPVFGELDRKIELNSRDSDAIKLREVLH